MLAVVDETRHLVGVVNLATLVSAADDVLVADLMNRRPMRSVRQWTGGRRPTDAGG